MSIAQIGTPGSQNGGVIRTILNNVINLNNIYTCPENYGWDVGNTVTQNTTAIQDAVDSGFPIFFGPKTYEINSAIVIPDNCKIFGCGSLSVIYTQSNISIFDIQGSYCNIESLKFLGNDTGANQRGISAVGNGTYTLYYLGNKVTNCEFVDLKGAGMYATEIIGTSGGNNSEGAFQVSNCRAVSCEVGFHCAVRGEYNSFSNCIANNCIYGFRNRGGNNNWTGGSLTGCTYGIYLETGTNDGHSNITGAKLNHNTNNIYVNGLGNGYSFVGCDVYVGDVILLNATGLRFIGSTFSALTNLTITSCTSTKFSSNIFITNPSNYNLTGTAPLYMDNQFLAGNPSFALNTFSSNIAITDVDCVLSATTGTKWATATSQKQSWYNSTPVVQQTTGIAAASFVSNTSGTVNDSATFGGYTIGQIVAALKAYGFLA